MPRFFSASVSKDHPCEKKVPYEKNPLKIHRVFCIFGLSPADGDDYIAQLKQRPDLQNRAYITAVDDQGYTYLYTRNSSKGIKLKHIIAMAKHQHLFLDARQVKPYNIPADLSRFS